MSDPLPLVDTNIFVRRIRQVHPDHSPRATAFLLQIRRGERTSQTNESIKPTFSRFSRQRVMDNIVKSSTDFQ